MSIRYGIALIPEPSFTARVYRARQLICGQYACWAAEMHMLHLTVADFFSCPEEVVGDVDTALAKVAEKSGRETPQFAMSHLGVATFPGVAGNIFLDFATSGRSEAVYLLHRAVMSHLEEVPGVVPDQRYAGDNYWPHITLMQRANLPPAVFDGAVEFANAVTKDLQVPDTAHAWQLALARFESDAAGDDWDDGRWAADLRWQLVNTYRL